eukprot:scaffold278982_cov19-Prasinocladus_malaysianus.AAC.1
MEARADLQLAEEIHSMLYPARVTLACRKGELKRKPRAAKAFAASQTRCACIRSGICRWQQNSHTSQAICPSTNVNDKCANDSLH